jgi:hypothetical protein
VLVIHSGKLSAGGAYMKRTNFLLEANIEKWHEEVNDKGICNPA